MKLYEIAEEMALLQRMLQEEEGVDEESFTKAIDACNIELGAKIANIGLLVKEINADIAARDAVIKDLQARNKAASNRVDWLKGYICAHINEPVKTPLIRVRKQQGRERVDIIGDLPTQYLIQQEPIPDKAAIMAALKADLLVEGAVLGRGDDYVVIQ